MSFSLISNARQMFTENLYMVTEELCHMSPSEMVDAAKSLPNIVIDIALKADALIQAVFKKEISNEIAATLKQVTVPIYKIITNTPLSKVAKILVGSIIVCSTLNRIDGTTLGIPIMFAHCATISGVTSIIFGILSGPKVNLGYLLRHSIIFAKITFSNLLGAMSTYYVSDPEMDSSFNSFFIKNLAQATLVSSIWPISLITLQKIDLSKSKELIPNIYAAYQKKLNRLHCYIKYKKTDQILKESDPRMISAFENNVAELIHDYIGLKNNSINPLHVSIKNLLKINSELVVNDIGKIF